MGKFKYSWSGQSMETYREEVTQAVKEMFGERVGKSLLSAFSAVHCCRLVITETQIVGNKAYTFIGVQFEFGSAEPSSTIVSHLYVLTPESSGYSGQGVILATWRPQAKGVLERFEEMDKKFAELEGLM